MKLIFNSLGSNYSTWFVWAAVKAIFWSPAHSAKNLVAELQKRYEVAEVQLVYKGRDAIELALRRYEIGEGDVVLVQAFTCAAIEEAVVRTGAKVAYVDLDQATANPVVKTYSAVLAQHKRVKAMLVQHTLGEPAQIEQLARWAKQNQLILIEDLASAVGGKTVTGKELGSWGDVVVLSFGRDKIIDAVAGGAALFRVKPARLSPKLPQVPWQVVLNDLLYPLITWKIRTFYAVGLGKILHWIVTKVGLLRSPVVSPTSGMAALPRPLAHLAWLQWQQLEANIQHRRRVATAYQEELASWSVHHSVENSSFVRFSLRVPEPELVVQFFRQHGWQISDRWYRTAVDCGRQNCQTSYKPASCLVAEAFAQTVVNLPTHRQVTVVKARKMAGLLHKILLDENQL